MTDRSRRELMERIDELEATVEELREELEPERGPMGLPRPPRPREMLRFTDEYAIPAAIAALEANVRALELVQAGIRASDPERTVEGTRGAVGDRTSRIGRASLDRLERTLADVEAAVEDSGMPGNREARDLVADARRLNEEIRDAMESGRPTADRGTSAERGSGRPAGRGADRSEAIRIEVVEEGDEGESEASATGSVGSDVGPEDDADSEDEDVGVEADVEAELEAVKEEVESEGDGDDETEE